MSIGRQSWTMDLKIYRLALRTLIKSEYIKLYVELHDIVLGTNKNRPIRKR